MKEFKFKSKKDGHIIGLFVTGIRETNTTIIAFGVKNHMGKSTIVTIPKKDWEKVL